jgi:hypothetical protein
MTEQQISRKNDQASHYQGLIESMKQEVNRAKLINHIGIYEAAYAAIENQINEGAKYADFDFELKVAKSRKKLTKSEAATIKASIKDTSNPLKRKADHLVRKSLKRALEAFKMSLYKGIIDAVIERDKNYPKENIDYSIQITVTPKRVDIPEQPIMHWMELEKHEMYIKDNDEAIVIVHQVNEDSKPTVIDGWETLKNCIITNKIPQLLYFSGSYEEAMLGVEDYYARVEEGKEVDRLYKEKVFKEKNKVRRLIDSSHFKYQLRYS